MSVSASAYLAQTDWENLLHEVKESARQDQAIAIFLFITYLQVKAMLLAARET